MFHVDWDDLATADLTAEWLTADSPLRATITAAVYEIEQRLMRAPDTAGESREPGTRVLILSPLTVTFHLNVRTKIVLISGLRVRHPRS